MIERPRGIAGKSQRIGRVSRRSYLHRLTLHLHGAGIQPDVVSLDIKSIC
jgi:hypothetical protein